MTKGFVLTAMLAMSVALPVARAASPVQRTNSVYLDFTKVISMDQLRQLLEEQGYTNILLSPVKPNATNPRPDIQDSGPRALKSVDPADTAVHKGWNGTAVKNGKQYNIEIDKRGRMLVH